MPWSTPDLGPGLSAGLCPGPLLVSVLVSVLDWCGLGRRPQLVPVDPVLPWTQRRQRDESLAQNRVFPEGPVSEDPQVDDPVVQVPPKDPLVDQHFIVGGVAGPAGGLGLPLAGLVRIWEQVDFDVRVWVCAVGERLQSSDVHDHDEELLVLVGNGQFDFSKFFP